MLSERKYQRILVFELNWLGDIIFSLPLLEALKKGSSGSRITCVVVPRYRKILEKCGLVDEIIELTDGRGIASLGNKLFTVLKIAGKYDICFLLKPSKSKALMAVAAGIRQRIGFSGKEYPVTDSVDIDLTAIHRVDSLLTLASVLGINASDGRYHLKITQEDLSLARDFIDTVVPGRAPYIAVHPGGNWGAKRWEKTNFADLIKRIIGKNNDMRVLVTGASGDAALAEEICAAVNDQRCINLSGKTGLDTLMSLFKLSKAVISADSGPLHLASAAGADTVSIFGPTSPLVTGPRGKGRNIVLYHDTGCVVPCYEPLCIKNYECMRAITVDEVFSAVQAILDKRS